MEMGADAVLVNTAIASRLTLSAWRSIQKSDRGRPRSAELVWARSIGRLRDKSADGYFSGKTTPRLKKVERNNSFCVVFIRGDNPRPLLPTAPI